MRLSLAAAALALGAFTVAVPARGQDWTRFRGPNGSGITSARGVPTTWTERDFRWRVPTPGAGHSQPVIWGDRLFLTSATAEGRERVLVCLDKHTGRELWTRTYALPTHRPINRNSSYANASAVVDAGRVVACFVSAEHFWVRAFDHAGKELWAHDLGTFESQHGHGASPIIHDGRVVVTNDQDGRSFVVAFDLADGREVWRTPRRTSRNGTAYGTPCLQVRADGREELLFTSQSHGISSLDPRTGTPNWESPVFNKRMAASPVVAGDLVIGSCGQGGGAGNYLTAVRLGGSGDVSKTHVAYTLRSGTPYVPTPLYREGRLFWISDGGVAAAIDAATGRELWSERVRAEFFASPVIIDGRIFCPSTKGEMLVLGTGETFELLARNPLLEGSHATPCVDGGRLYVRTFTHLLCLGSP